MTDDETRIDLEGYLSWRGNLRAPQSWGGLNADSFDTFGAQGGVFVDFDAVLGLSIGFHKKFGFYIDTARTGFTGSVTAGLTKDFKAKALIFDIANDSQNPTQVKLKFTAGLKDIDNGGTVFASSEGGTVKFLDVDGDGELDAKPFKAPVFQDADKNNQPDLKLVGGNLVYTTVDQSVAEPFTFIQSTEAAL